MLYEQTKLKRNVTTVEAKRKKIILRLLYSNHLAYVLNFTNAKNELVVINMTIIWS
jgi:hypothetical protein